MNKAVCSLFQGDRNSGLTKVVGGQRHGVGRGWPARKIITKKDQGGKCKGKPVQKRARHCSFSTRGSRPTLAQNCQMISIQETTQQAPSSSSNSKQSALSQPECELAPRHPEAEAQKNSNPMGQRTSEVHEYLQSISLHMHEKEALYIPKPIVDPGNISEYNRTKLVSWIFDLGDRFGFRGETGYLAVNLVDRVLGLARIALQRLPLLGITALFMATKYEEIMIPHLTNFISAVPESYKVTVDSVLRLQSNLLLMLNFDLGYCSPLLFIHQYSLSSNLSEELVLQAQEIAKGLITSSACRYWSASRLAAYAINTAQEDAEEGRICPALGSGLVAV